MDRSAITPSRPAWSRRVGALQLAVLIAGTSVVGPVGGIVNAQEQRSTSHRSALQGPIAARVLRVVDGDTIRVRAMVWLGQYVEVSVRLDEIDAPELNSRCRTTRNRAWRARNQLHQLVSGTTVQLHSVRRGKYAGRVVASVHTTDGRRVSELLLASGVADPFVRRSRKRRLSRNEACQRLHDRTAQALPR